MYSSSSAGLHMSIGQIRREERKVVNKKEMCKSKDKVSDRHKGGCIVIDGGGGCRAVVQRREVIKQCNQTRDHREVSEHRWWWMWAKLTKNSDAEMQHKPSKAPLYSNFPQLVSGSYFLLVLQFITMFPTESEQVHLLRSLSILLLLPAHF